MSNPFAPKATTPAAAPAGGNPFASTPAATPPATTPPATTPATTAPGGPVDPFGSVPDAPKFEGLSADDAAGAGTVVALRVVKYEEGVLSTFRDEKTGEPVVQNRLTVDAWVINGPKAGDNYPDTWLFWRRVVAQFKDCVGNGQWYLVKLTKSGRAVVAEPVNDPAMRAEAGRIMQGGAGG